MGMSYCILQLITEHKRTRWWRRRWTWSTSLSRDISGIHLQTQKWMQNAGWEQTGVPEQWKRTYRTTQNSVGQGTRGKNRSVSRTGPALGRRGNWNRGLIPTAGQLSESEEKHLRLRVKQLTCGSLHGMRIRQSLLATMHTLDRDAGPLEGTVAGNWSLGIVEQSQGEGCCWLRRDGLRGCEGGDCGGKCLWRKARQPWKQGYTAESCEGVEPSP